MLNPFTDESIMPFGKYKGEKMANVPPDYLLWIYEQQYNSVTARAVNAYIKDNLDVIKSEIELKNKSK